MRESQTEGWETRKGREKRVGSGRRLGRGPAMRQGNECLMLAEGGGGSGGDMMCAEATAAT